MQNVNIRTAQNVGIKYDLAGLGPRMGAFLIDALIQGVYLFLVFFTLASININSLWISIMVILPVFLYHLLSEIIFDGQSIGKKQMNIKVVRLDGSSPTLGGYILRWILRPFEITLFYGAIATISIAMTKNGQRLGDMAAGTTVVKVTDPTRVTSHELINNFKEDYQVTFPQVRKLNDKQIGIIQEALHINKTQANSKPALAIAKKIQEYLEVSTDMPPVKFLYTVMKDYKYVTSQI